MKWNVILSDLFAATALALPGTSHGPKGAASGLQARDVPLWAATFANAVDSTSAGFGRVQVQYYNGTVGEVLNNGPPIPVITHSKLGKALKIHLGGYDPTTNPLTPAQMRWEAAPGAAKDCKEGDEYYFRVDFVLGLDFPVDQPRTFNLINQIHQGKNTGSPPVEFDVSSGRLAVRGENAGLHTNYVRDLGAMRVDTLYKLVYHVKFSKDPKKSLLEVWLNDRQVLFGFQPPTATMDVDGLSSYWKGATAYCHWTIPPLTVYQNAHRVGRTLASVNT